jgi:3-deoxy-D-manno-octulosonic-acid transferase
VQSEEVRNALIEAGADPKRVGVTGNIKFDAAEYPGWSTTMARDPALLASIVASKRVVIVAGCMTSGEEQTHVLSAFSDLLSKHQNALLVIAPRHPEKSEIIATLAGALEKLGIIHLFRTQLRDEPLPNHVSCLILDTIGELRDFYAAASIAYVGRNHNILEPLGFGKPTVVRAGWNRLYPSYSVYEIMLRAGGIYQIEGESELCTLLDSMLTDTANGISLEKKAELALITATGATRRNMECLEPILRAVSDLH